MRSDNDVSGEAGAPAREADEQLTLRARARASQHSPSFGSSAGTKRLPAGRESARHASFWTGDGSGIGEAVAAEGAAYDSPGEEEEGGGAFDDDILRQLEDGGASPRGGRGGAAAAGDEDLADALASGR